MHKQEIVDERDTTRYLLEISIYYGTWDKIINKIWRVFIKY